MLGQPADYNDEEGDWADPAVFSAGPPGFEAGPWSWHGPKTTVTGPAWGGCLEILDFQLRASRYLLPEAVSLASATTGGQGPLHRGTAPGRAGGGSRISPQRSYGLRVDFGHTEPQYVIPSGGTVTIDSSNERIEVSY